MDVLYRDDAFLPSLQCTLKRIMQVWVWGWGTGDLDFHPSIPSTAPLDHYGYRYSTIPVIGYSAMQEIL